MFYIDSQYPVNRLICYDQQGKIIQAVQVSVLNGSLRDIRIAGDARTIALWAEEPEYRISILTEAISVR
jgi:hypothetical protein